MWSSPSLHFQHVSKKSFSSLKAEIQRRLHQEDAKERKKSCYRDYIIFNSGDMKEPGLGSWLALSRSLDSQQLAWKATVAFWSSLYNSRMITLVIEYTAYRLCATLGLRYLQLGKSLNFISTNRNHIYIFSHRLFICSNLWTRKFTHLIVPVSFLPSFSFPKNHLNAAGIESRAPVLQANALLITLCLLLGPWRWNLIDFRLNLRTNIVDIQVPRELMT